MHGLIKAHELSLMEETTSEILDLPCGTYEEILENFEVARTPFSAK